MNAHEDPHLDEDQLLMAVVDESDLSMQLRTHLSTCPLCRNNREQFGKSLEKLGRMPEKFTPTESGKELFPRIYPAPSVGFHGI